ncbi:MAG: 50S ribosomal protein L24 [Calditrichales bacterium]|nr:MAG: 50S ribosomal protein L24 [Calditrichales bacterium]
MRIVKNDTVKILTGKYRGKTGKVLKVFPKDNRVVVEGVNIIKRHTKASQKNAQGGIVEKEAPINVSNVILIDPKTNEPTRIGYKSLEDGTKVRVSKKSSEMLGS